MPNSPLRPILASIAATADYQGDPLTGKNSVMPNWWSCPPRRIPPPLRPRGPAIPHYASPRCSLFRLKLAHSEPLVERCGWIEIRHYTAQNNSYRWCADYLSVGTAGLAPPVGVRADTQSSAHRSWGDTQDHSSATGVSGSFLLLACCNILKFHPFWRAIRYDNG